MTYTHNKNTIRMQKNIWKYDEFLELSNVLYLFHYESHLIVLNMISDIQSIVEQIHDYCIVSVCEQIDIDTCLPTLRFTDENIHFISDKIEHIDYILYKNLRIIIRDFSQNSHVMMLIHAIKEKSRDYDFRYYTSVAYEEWNSRYYDAVMFNNFHSKMHTKRNKQKNKKEFGYVAHEQEKKILESGAKDVSTKKMKKSGSTGSLNLFNTSTWSNWFDLGEPLLIL
jgi:hypothetical protein